MDKIKFIDSFVAGELLRKNNLTDDIESKVCKIFRKNKKLTSID